MGDKTSDTRSLRASLFFDSVTVESELGSLKKLISTCKIMTNKLYIYIHHCIIHVYYMREDKPTGTFVFFPTDVPVVPLELMNLQEIQS